MPLTSSDEHLKFIKNWGRSSRCKICPNFCPWYAVTMATYFQVLLKKGLAHHGNHAKTEEIVCNRIFSIILAHNVSCYHGNTPFVTVEGMCHADLHPKINVQYEFHENWQNTDEAVLPWSIFLYILPTCHYHGNAVFATFEICVLHINISRRTSVPNFIKIDQKLWDEFAT